MTKKFASATALFLSLAFIPLANAEVAPASDQWRQFSKSGMDSLNLGDYASAETQFKTALGMVQSNSSLKDSLPRVQGNYGESLLQQGKFKEASKEIKKALSLSKSISGKDSLDYAYALTLQSWILQADGKRQDAMQMLKDVLALYSVKAPDSPELADGDEHMAVLSESMGLYDQATEYYTKALNIRKKTSGEQSIDVADLSESLAHMAQRRGQTQEALALYAAALRIKEAQGAPYKAYAPEPTDRTVMFRYFQNAPFCETATAGGMLIEKITANGITVEAGINQKPSEFAKTTRAQVRIVNDSQYDVDILTQSPTFIQVTPDVVILKPINAQALAAQIQKKGESKAKWIRFWGADAMTPVTSTMYSNNAPVYGYVPNGFGWNGGGRYNNNWNRGNNWSTTNVTTMVPDFQARAEALRKAQEAAEKSKADASAVLDAALGPNRLPSGGAIQGTLDFELSKYTSAILRIPIGNAVYEFRFQ